MEGFAIQMLSYLQLDQCVAAVLDCCVVGDSVSIVGDWYVWLYSTFFFLPFTLAESDWITEWIYNENIFFYICFTLR